MGGERELKAAAAGGPRRGRPPQVVHEGLLQDAAVEVFATATYEGASVKAIAARAGIARSLLHRRFGSKEQIFAWALDREAEYFTSYLMIAYDSGAQAPPRQLLRRGTVAVFDYARERPFGFRLLFQVGHHGPSAVELPIERVRRIVTGRVEQLVWQRADADDDVYPLAIASMIVGGVEHLAGRIVARDDVDPEAATDAFVHLVMRGLAGIEAVEVAR